MKRIFNGNGRPLAMDMLDVHHIAIYDDLIAAKVQGCTSLVFSERASRISIKISSIIRLFQFQVLQIKKIDTIREIIRETKEFILASRFD